MTRDQPRDSRPSRCPPDHHLQLQSPDQHSAPHRPYAQDFNAAFHVGESDRTISTVDADGIALAAIQGLNQKWKKNKRESKLWKKRWLTSKKS